jgi:hypothetical protein
MPRRRPHCRPRRRPLATQVRKLEKFNVDGHELMDRVRMLEDRLEVVARAKMPDIDPQVRRLHQGCTRVL